MEQDSTAQLPRLNLPVYMTRNVAAAKAKVNPRTFEKYVPLAALRHELDGKLSALYTDESIAEFWKAYQPEISGGA